MTDEPLRGRVAISIHIMVFIASVSVGIIYMIVLQEPAHDLLDFAATLTDHPAHAQGIEYVRDYLDWLILIIIGISGFGLIIDAAYERGGTF